MTYKILTITNDPRDAATLKDVFANARGDTFHLLWVKTLATAIRQLRKNNIDAVIADLTLPDSDGIATFDRLVVVAPHMPIMILVTGHDDLLISKALARGAQGYLTKNSFNSNLVPQAMRNLIRQRVIAQDHFNEKARAEIALNSIGDAVLCTNLTGNVDYLNIAAETLTGWPRVEARGRPVAEVFKLINGITRQAVRSPVADVIQKNKPMGLDADTLLIRRDNSEVAIEDSISPIHDWNGRLTGAVIVFHNASDTKALSKKWRTRRSMIF